MRRLVEPALSRAGARGGSGRGAADDWQPPAPPPRRPNRCYRRCGERTSGTPDDSTTPLTGPNSAHQQPMPITSRWRHNRCARMLPGARTCLVWFLGVGPVDIDSLALPWPLWYLGAWRMQSCYSSPQQLQAAAAAALSFHQHQHRLAFPLMPGGMSRLDQRDQRDNVDDDLNDDISSRLTAERRVRFIYTYSVFHLHACSQSGTRVNVPRQKFSCKRLRISALWQDNFRKIEKRREGRERRGKGKEGGGRGFGGIEPNSLLNFRGDRRHWNDIYHLFC